MSGLRVGAGLRIRDVMSAPVVTVRESDTADKIAKVINEKKVGSVIVLSKSGKPVGIVTERDLAVRVIEKKLPVSKVTAKEIMSSPLVTVSYDADTSEASRLMRRLGIKHLAVMNKGRLVGIVSSRDLATISQELASIASEREKILRPGVSIPETAILSGYCDGCGHWSSMLREVEGKFLCEDCRAELGI